MPLISLIIINYNTKNFLKRCIEAILAQKMETIGDEVDSAIEGDGKVDEVLGDNSQQFAIEIVLIDNASSDGSAEWAKNEYAHESRVRVIANPDNKGYAGAANQGIRETKGEFVVITNPDILYEPDYFENAMKKMQEDKHIAALTGKIKKYDFANDKKTNIIDTVGLFIYRNRRVIDDGQGLPDDGRFDEEKEVFGVSGACPLYRRAALEDVKICGEYLDNDFFMYKEDVDLSWRFQLFGWKCWYYPKAIAYHGRGTGVAQRFTDAQVMQQRAKLSPFQKKYSYTNQRLMQIKNELSGNFWQDVMPIVAKEIGTLGYMTFKEPYLWKSVWQLIKLMPKAFEKRTQIMQRKKVSAKEMERWFGEQSEYVRE